MSLEAQWFNAVNQGDMEQVTQLLEASPKLLVQLAGSDRRTALHIAAIHGNDQLVALLLTKARGVEEVLHVGDALFRTPLHLAARYGHEKVAAQLLATRVDPTLVDVSGMTPLHLAAQEGYSSVLELLLAAKPEMVDEVDANDRTVLHTAARKGHEQLVARLLVLRPQMVHAMDAMGRTALHYATAHGFDTVVGLLLAASPTAIYAVSDRGQNALHEAARNKQEAIANMLLEFVSYNEASKGRSSDGGGSGGSDGNRLVRAIDGEGHTVLHTVIERECSLQLVMRVLEVFPQALHVAVGHCQANVVKKMLAVGPITEAHASAVHLAVSNGFEDIADMLLQQCLVAAYTPDSRGNTLLHLTVKAKHTTLFVERVWRLNLDALRQMNHDRVTPFHLAIRTYNDRLVEMWQWGLTIDEILSDYGPYATRFKLVVEAQCEGLFQHLNQDVAGTVFEYFGFERPRGRY